MSDEVIIGGYVPGTIPDWALEATQRSLLDNAKIQSSNSSKLVNLLAKSIATGGVTNDELRNVIEEIKKSSRDNDKSLGSVEEAVDKVGKEVSDVAKNQDRYFPGLIAAIGDLSIKLTDIQRDILKGTDITADKLTQMINDHDDTMAALELSLESFEDIKTILKENGSNAISGADFAELTKSIRNLPTRMNGDNPMGDFAATVTPALENVADALGIAAGAQAGGAVGGPLGAVIGAGAGKLMAELTTAGMALINAVNDYSMTLITERYEFATELRQRGALSGLNTSFADLAIQVKETGFTMAEASDMVQKFSGAVGIYGVKNSMDFVNELAYGQDYIGRYNMQFGQVINLAGDFLETQKNLGQLSQMTEARRDRGMNAFMDAVVSTSNTMKISLEEAADLLTGVFERDDLTALIATMGRDVSPELQASVSQMTATFGSLGEFISLGALDRERFQITPQYMEMMSQPVLMPLLGFIDEMSTAMRNGASAAELQALYGGQLRDMMTSDDLTRQLAAMDADSQRLISEVVKFADPSRFADAGFTTTADDAAASQFQDAQRLLVQRLEGVGTSITGAFDSLETTLGTQTTALNNFSGTIARAGEESAPIVADAMDIALSAGAIALDTAAGAMNAAALSMGYLTDSLREINGLGASSSDISGELLQGTESFLPNFISGAEAAVSSDTISQDLLVPLADAVSESLSRGSDAYSGFWNNAFYRRQNAFVAQGHQIMRDMLDSSLGLSTQNANGTIGLSASNLVGLVQRQTSTGGGLSELGFDDKELEGLVSVLEGARNNGNISASDLNAIITELTGNTDTAKAMREEMSNSQFERMIAELRRIRGAVVP
jgi:hypothetical protein